jgi:pilus assembly protein CpaC
MSKRAAVLLGAMLATIAAGAGAQSPPPDMAPATPTVVQPASPPPAGAPARPVPPRTISLQAGTGTLLRLPQPAATVMSAQPAVARVQPASPTSLFLMAVAPGHTTLIATDQAGQPIVQYDVTVTPGPGQPPPGAAGAMPGAPGTAEPAAVTAETAAKVRATIAQMVPGAADLSVMPAGRTVVLRGTVPDAAAATQAEAIARGFLGARTSVINEMQVLGRLQVNVRVRVAEIDRQITRELGFNWQALGNGGNWRLGLLGGAGAAGPISAVAPLGITPLGNVPAGQFGAGYSSSRWNIDNLIDALAADQLITILAEPNLTALSGESASFLAGGEFPIPVAGYATGPGGIPEITVEFKQFGVSLTVVPTVLSDNRLNLRIRPEVSQLSSAGAVSVPMGTGTLTIPALTVRRAETTVELGSGQSFAIAGLLQKTSTDLTNAIPGIGEMPVLGALFKSNSFQRGESELVIVVTPYIVRPAASPSLLQYPTDGFVPATDLDRVLLGRQLAPSAGARPLNAGFVLK